jgi:hypothetical protein
MNCLLTLMLLMAPAEVAKKESRLLEDVLAAKEKPGDEAIMVHTRILVHHVDKKKKVMGVKFADAKLGHNVNIKIWDKKLHELKPETMIKVTGQLHFGPVKGGAPSIRYKVQEQSGRVYNDHRHWRTDRAIYIINPTYEIVDEAKAPEKEAEKKDEKQEETK